MDKDGGQKIHEEQVKKDQDQIKTYYPLNDPGDYLLQNVTIFYGRTATQIAKC
jgi:hypothetical protein